MRYSIESGTIKYINGYWGLSLLGNKKTIIEYTTRFFKNCFQKRSLYNRWISGNKMADVVTMSNSNKVVKTEPVEEIIIPP